MHWIYDLPLLVLALLLMLSSVAFAMGSVLAVRALKWRIDEADNGAAAALHAFVGVLYAVSLGLLVVGAQQDYGDVEQAVVMEANATGNLYRALVGLEPANRVRLRAELARYVELVIHDEWPKSQHGERSAATWGAMDRLANDIYTLQPATAQEERLYSSLVGEIQEVLDARRLRLFLGEQGVGMITWVIIVVGGIITIGFPAHFRFRSLAAHLFLSGLMGAMFGLMITLLVAMDHPLWGRMAVKPDAFLQLQVNFTTIHREEIVRSP
jgi:hypothetical protein